MNLMKVFHPASQGQNRQPGTFYSFHRIYSTPVMEQLQSWCSRQIDEKIVEPNSSLGQTNRINAQALEETDPVLQVPEVPLDKILCERAFKHSILHRKNALFF
jgi:transposase